jgi:ketosteroid isomerase-like protein
LTHKNAAVVLQAADAANRRDPDAFLACVADDVEWEVSGEGLPGLRSVYRGQAGVREWFEAVVLELWADSQFEREEIVEAPDGRVLIGALFTTRGQASGVETQRRFWQVFRLREGLITGRKGFIDRVEALEAAGLQE